MRYPFSKPVTLIFLGFLYFCADGFRPLAHASVDLHAHLWMEHGVPGFAFQGCFDCPLKAQNWSGIRGSRANRDTLEKSGLKLMVAALYAHPLAPGWSSRGAIRNQIRAARAWLRENPEWVLARSANEARVALKGGKRVLVFSLEGAGDILENEEDLQEFVDEGGISIVSPMHFLDNDWGGCALLHGGGGWLFNPLARLKAWWSGRSVNTQGLTEAGAEKLRALIARKVWVDLSHASDVTQSQMRPWLETAGQPPLYTHTALRKYHHAERGISEDQLDYVSKKRGIIGLIPSRLMVGDVPQSQRARPSCQSGTGVDGFAAHYRDVSQKVGVDSVMLGSDFNSPMEYLESGGGVGCTTGTDLDQPNGFWKISQVAELWKAVQSTGVKTPQNQDQWLDRFIEVWERVRP